MKISVVSYINTLPFRYGIENSPVKPDGCNYSVNPPSECAQKLIDGTADAGLIPVASIAQLNRHVIFSDYCIAAEKEAFSVLILSHKPIEKIEKILLDYQSRSSVAMLKILNENFMHFSWEFVDAGPGFENYIYGSSAGLVIGDRAMLYRSRFEYVYDLATLWRRFTDYPAVFAVWVANTDVSLAFAEKFDAMLKFGISNLSRALKKEYPGKDTSLLHDYFTKNLSYRLNDQKRQSIGMFLKLLTNEECTPNFLK